MNEKVERAHRLAVERARKRRTLKKLVEAYIDDDDVGEPPQKEFCMDEQIQLDHINDKLCEDLARNETLQVAVAHIETIRDDSMVSAGSIISHARDEQLHGHEVINESTLLGKIEAVLKIQMLELKKSIIPRITMLENEIIELKAIIVSQEKTLNKNILTWSEFCNLYQHFKFPLQAKESFENLNAEIINNTELIANNIEKYFITDTNIKVQLTDNMINITKKMLTKEVLLHYTAQNPRPNKSVFKETEFYKKLEAALIKAYSNADLNSSSVLKALSTILHNVKDWDGGRTERAKRPNNSS